MHVVFVFVLGEEGGVVGWGETLLSEVWGDTY